MQRRPRARGNGYVDGSSDGSGCGSDNTRVMVMAVAVSEAMAASLILTMVWYVWYGMDVHWMIYKLQYTK